MGKNRNCAKTIFDIRGDFEISVFEITRVNCIYTFFRQDGSYSRSHQPVQ